MVAGFFLIPVPPSMDIRGWIEMYPLNGPGWTLFFEYIGNILYATIIRKISNVALGILVFLAGCFLIHMAVSGKGDVIGGWSIDATNIHIGFARLLYPFLAGLLLSRIAKLSYRKNAFLWCSLLIISTLSVPRLGGQDNLWINGLYESLVIIFIFPLIVFIGASGEVKGRFSSRLCKFLGDISYPIYITHYPLIYLYTAWVKNNSLTLNDTYLVAIFLFVSSILLAYACLKLYDEPVRKWISKRILKFSFSTPVALNSITKSNP
jgi:peptidoglycan/LPS O-acetylase OafA/YrhL